MSETSADTCTCRMTTGTSAAALALARTRLLQSHPSLCPLTHPQPTPTSTRHMRFRLAKLTTHPTQKVGRTVASVTGPILSQCVQVRQCQGALPHSTYLQSRTAAWAIKKHWP